MITGKWKVEAESPLGHQESILDLIVVEDKLEGQLIDPKTGLGAAITDGMADGDGFSFNCVMELPPLGSLSAFWSGSVSGDAMSGETKVVMGATPFTGVRI